MKRIFTILCICLCVIPLFAVPSSAASYDLGTPYKLHYTNPFSADEKWLLSSYYDFNIETRLLDPISSISNSGFEYFSNYYDVSPVFRLGTITSGLRNIIMQGFDYSQPAFHYTNAGDVELQLIFNSIVYELLLLPSDGQFFKVNFSFNSPMIFPPDEVVDWLDPNYMCYLCDTSGRSGYRDRYSLPKVFPTSYVLRKVNNVFNYTFYFQCDSNTLLPLVDSDNVCLAIRMPFYFPPNHNFGNGISIWTNAELPSTYEILTVGGYDQSLKDIQSSVDSLKTDLFDFYTDQNSNDVAFISNANNVFDKGNDVINDYNNYNDQIDSIVTNAVVPDVQDIINEQIGDFTPAVAPVKEFFQNTYIISAFLICFAFCLISVLLYGIRG